MRHSRQALLALLLAVLAVTPMQPLAAIGSPREGMAVEGARPAYGTIPGGRLSSILPTGASGNEVDVAPFRLQSTPVTNGEYLAFVRAHPEWQRGRAAAMFADENYLRHWRGALTLGPNALPKQPVTHVSWFAARAFCESHNARLPSWYEWELAAAADEEVRDARRDPAWQQRILEWYSRPSSEPLALVASGSPNVYGIHDLHGLVWEWVEDFNALFVSADNREQGDPDLMKFCGAGALTVEDRESYAVLMRVAMLSSLQANSTTVNVGFRCALASPIKTASSAPTDLPPADSLYRLDVPLETQDGRRTAFAAAAGRVRIATMFYASCPMACPLIIDTLKSIDRQLTPAERARLAVLMVTLDPEHDSPAALTKLAAERKLDTSRWTLARTSPPDVRKISAALDVKYRKLEDGSFNHASVLVLLDRQGRVIARSTKIGTPDAEFVTAVRKALRDGR